MIRHLYVLGSHEKSSHEKAYADSSMRVPFLDAKECPYAGECLQSPKRAENPYVQ